MQAKQAAWHKKLHGTHGYAVMASNNQPFIRQAESEIVSAVKRNSVDEFKSFYQQLEASNPNFMKTIDDCHHVTFKFQNNYDPGIKFTHKTKSETKHCYVMEAKLVEHHQVTANLALNQQPQQFLSVPPGLTQAQCNGT